MDVALTKFEVALCWMMVIPLLLPLLHLGCGAPGVDVSLHQGPHEGDAIPLQHEIISKLSGER